MHKATFALLAALPLVARAQSATIPPVDEQIVAAVSPLPADLRAGAKVYGYRTAAKLEVIRGGTNGMHCLALYVTRTNDFHVACYHEGLEPFMARGRELRDQGTPANQVDTVRFAEVKSGKLKMPAQGVLYQLTGPRTGWDAATRKVTGATPLTVLYLPFATAASSGFSTTPARSGPWLMSPGTAKAHVMIIGTMQ